jgi:hypothetical protein
VSAASYLVYLWHPQSALQLKIQLVKALPIQGVEELLQELEVSEESWLEEAWHFHLV